MKIYCLLTLFLSIVMIFLPFMSLGKNQSTEKEQNKTETVTVADTESNETEETELMEYIIGCVAAEMPALYETEALKAQAVACYTYQKYLKEHGTDEISDSGKIHQAYKTKDELKDLWGEKYDTYYEKISLAVESVYKEYLVCDGETALTLFHSLSDGKTNTAKDVFGKDIKNLKSVNAPGDRLSPDYISEQIFSESEFFELLFKKKIISDKNSLTVKTEEDTESGYTESIKVESTVLSPSQAREVFSLNSPYFKLEKTDSSYKFTVYGKGHGVGMSQYSADYMARQGYNYEEILLHFYKDTELIK